MAQIEDAEFPIAKTLRERIFKIPLLPQDQIVPRFAEIDELLYPLTIQLTERVPAIRDYFKDIVHKVASGSTLGKNYFHKQDNEDQKTDSKKILKTSEVRILSESFALLRHSSKPKKFSSILRRSAFMRGVMEEAVEMFFDLVENYSTLRDNLAEAEAAQSLEFVRYEREMHTLLDALGLEADEQDVLEALMQEVESKWEEYLEKREAIIAPYYRLVYTIAGGFSQSDSQTLDNFQNGLIGLLRAYKCYTPSRFAAFSLVAEQWIKQSILLHIKTEVNFIKLPIANWHAYQKLEKIRAKLEQKSNREVSVEEISDEAKMPLEKVKKIYEYVKLAKVLSLNVPTHNEDDQNEGPSWSLESVTDERDLESELEAQAEYEIVRKVVHHFDEEETIIFALISGCLDLVDNSDISPEERERETIRQIAARHGIGITFK